MLTRDPRSRAQRLCHDLDQSSLACFGPFAPVSRPGDGGFPNPPDDKTVRKSHFCSGRCQQHIQTKLLSAESLRTANETDTVGRSPCASVA